MASTPTPSRGPARAPAPSQTSTDRGTSSSGSTASGLSTPSDPEKERSHQTPSEKVIIVVDSSEVEFELSRTTLLSTSSGYFHRLLRITKPPGPTSPAHSPLYRMRPSVRHSDFHDFALWLRTGRILQRPHNHVPYAVAHAASTLVTAMHTAARLDCAPYQTAAMTDFLQLGRLLPWPEDYVDRIFDIAASAAAFASASADDDDHPVRWLIVSIVAAQTGPGRRPVRLGPPDGCADPRAGIHARGFREMYTRWCRTARGRCVYPQTLEDATRLIPAGLVVGRAPS